MFTAREEHTGSTDLHATLLLKALVVAEFGGKLPALVGYTSVLGKKQNKTPASSASEKQGSPRVGEAVYRPRQAACNPTASWLRRRFVAKQRMDRPSPASWDFSILTPVHFALSQQGPKKVQMR